MNRRVLFALSIGKCPRFMYDISALSPSQPLRHHSSPTCRLSAVPLASIIRPQKTLNFSQPQLVFLGRIRLVHWRPTIYTPALAHGCLPMSYACHEAAHDDTRSHRISHFIINSGVNSGRRSEIEYQMTNDNGHWRLWIQKRKPLTPWERVKKCTFFTSLNRFFWGFQWVPHLY
jgi:hypothetical protein